MKRSSILIVIFVTTILSLNHATVQEHSGAWTLRKSYTVKVLEIHDGDTVRVQFRNGIRDTVRMLGIDTPETSAGDTSPDEFNRPDTEKSRRALAQWGRKASRWLKSRINPGDKVTLRFDDRSDYRGSYGRLLGYIIRDGTNLNAELIRHGLARVYPSPFSLKTRFKTAQQQAKRDGSGVWGNARASRGDRTEKQTGSADTSDVNCSENVYNCSDFDTYREALRVFKACGGVDNDIHRLDGNGDGEPCESLK